MVSTEVVKKTHTYLGKRARFEYDHVSEQNGKRKDCCILIPASKVSSSARTGLIITPACTGVSLCTLEVNNLLWLHLVAVSPCTWSTQ